MDRDLEKLRLADKTEAILRSDRQALRQAHSQPQNAAILLALLPTTGAVIDLMDAYLPDLAEKAGLQYIRMVSKDVTAIPKPVLNRALLVLADLSGRDEDVITLVYQALGAGRRVLLSAQSPDDLPADLRHLPSVTYDLAAKRFDQLIRAVGARSVSTVDDEQLVAQ